MKNTSTILLIGVILLAMSCRKDPEGGTNAVDQADVNLKLHHQFDGAPLQIGTVYTDDFGTQYTYTRAQIYMSNFDLGGSKLNTYLLVGSYVDALNDTVPFDTTFLLGSLPEGHYHDLEFAVGVDSLTNHADPAQYTPGEPLGLQIAPSPSTHWNWSSGYLFIMLEGQIDTTGDGTMDDTFEYHVGGDMLYRTTSLTVHHDVPAEGETLIELDLNWAALVDGIDMVNNRLTHTMNNMPLATAIANNVQNVFTVHQ